MKYITIGAGGFFGAILRFYFEKIHIYQYAENIPLNTLIINVSGSFILALFSMLAFEVWDINPNIRLGIVTGLIGAYTTFLTLCKETTNLIKDGLYCSAFSYITISTVLGLGAVYFGVILSREFISKFDKK